MTEAEEELGEGRKGAAREGTTVARRGGVERRWHGPLERPHF